jgi:hypothetical protein
MDRCSVSTSWPRYSAEARRSGRIPQIGVRANQVVEYGGQAMRADGIWHTLGRLANLIGVVASLAALGLVGYFACLGFQVLRHGG